MNELPLNDVSTFGAAAHLGGSLSTVDLVAEAPPADPSRPRPAVRRVLSADGANLIVFHFAPGQDLPDHMAAHPITVQVLRGAVEFSCGERVEWLEPGRIVHLPARVPHGVTSTDQPAIMLLTMLTTQTHSRD